MTGKELWKVERKTDGRGEGEHSYASPAIWRDGDKAYLIVHGCDYTTAHDMTNGEELWRLGELNPKDRYNPTLRFVASPAAAPGVIVVPTAKKGPVIGLDPKARGLLGEKGKGELWRLPRGTPDVPSPLIFDNIVYLLREDGGLSAHEAMTGKELYFQRLHNTRYRSSPVYADGKIYCLARDGTCSVVQAGPTFKLLSVNKLPDAFGASPAIANGRIYLRGYENLWAVGPAPQ
jgi:outer membrane protein assembly factor BamB